MRFVWQAGGPVRFYAVDLAYMDQAKTASEVCAGCMWRMKFQAGEGHFVGHVYRLFERWLWTSRRRRSSELEI